MKRCLVTGGAGFIGSALVRHLLSGEEDAAGVGRVVVLDKLTYAGRRENLEECKKDPRFRFVQGDIADSDLVGKLLEEEFIDSVFHLAAESHVDRSIEGPEAFIQTNLVGTYRLLQAAREHQKKMKNGQDFRFLHVSTMRSLGRWAPKIRPLRRRRLIGPTVRTRPARRAAIIWRGRGTTPSACR